MRGSGTTNEKGSFRIGGLNPGKFKLLARMVYLTYPPEIRSDGTEEIHYSHTYYPDSPDERTAARVEVLPGREAGGMVIHALRAPMVKMTGTVSGIPEKGVAAFMSIVGEGLDENVDLKPNGAFEIWRLDPGEYVLTAIFSGWHAAIEIGADRGGSGDVQRGEG